MTEPEMVRLGDGRIIPGKIVSFNALHEPWSEYMTEEGVTVRIRSIVTRFVRLNKPGLDGGPSYLFQAQNVIDVQAPESEYIDPPSSSPPEPETP